MFVDEAGALWLSNPWLATMLLTTTVGLVVWCHRWLEIGKAPLPRRDLFRVRDGALRGRTLRSRQAVRPALVTISRLESSSRPIRMARVASFPRNAA